MPGESQVLPTTGQADPSVFTTQAIDKAVDAVRGHIDLVREVLEARILAVEQAATVESKALSTALDIANKETQRRLHDLNGEAQRLRNIQAEYWPREAAESYIKEQAASRDAILTRNEDTREQLEKASAASNKRLQDQIDEIRGILKETEGGAKEKLNQLNHSQWVFGAGISVLVIFINVLIYVVSHH